jgi:hypothetical protein
MDAENIADADAKRLAKNLEQPERNQKNKGKKKKKKMSAAAKKEKKKAYLKKWHEEHPNYDAEYNKRRRQEHPEKYKAKSARERAERRKLLESAKNWLGGKCSDCGSADKTVLQFDHIDPVTKLATVSQMSTCKANRAVFWAEVAKTALRCANCHFLRTHYSGGQAAYNELPYVVRHRQRVEEAKQQKGGRCTDCDVVGDLRLLVFNHLRDKKFLITGAFHVSDEEFLAEIQKCELICHNCHQVKKSKTERDNGDGDEIIWAPAAGDEIVWASPAAAAAAAASSSLAGEIFY